MGHSLRSIHLDYLGTHYVILRFLVCPSLILSHSDTVNIWEPSTSKKKSHKGEAKGSFEGKWQGAPTEPYFSKAATEQFYPGY